MPDQYITEHDKTQPRYHIAWEKRGNSNVREKINHSQHLKDKNRKSMIRHNNNPNSKITKDCSITSNYLGKTYTHLLFCSKHKQFLHNQTHSIDDAHKKN
jgi:hypothetical protein